MAKVLFLSNNENAKPLFEWLQQQEQTLFYDGKLTIEYVETLRPDIIVSYNYRYLIKEDIISYMKGNIVNLHISYLPWNRGSNPNFWSFIENSPKGVTIHLVDKGLDTGPVIVQQELFFDEVSETFATTYLKLQNAVVDLFKRNWQRILKREYTVKKQPVYGTYHIQKDMRDFLVGKNFSYDMRIADFKKTNENLQKVIL